MLTVARQIQSLPHARKSLPEPRILCGMSPGACQILTLLNDLSHSLPGSHSLYRMFTWAYQILVTEYSQAPAVSSQCLLCVHRHMLDFQILYRRTLPLKGFHTRLRIPDVQALSLGPKSNYTDWGHTVFLGWQPCEVVDIIRRFRDGLHIQHQSYERNWYSTCSDVPADIWRRVVRILTLHVASLCVLHSFFASCLTSFLFSIHFASLSAFFRYFFYFLPSFLCFLPSLFHVSSVLFFIFIPAYEMYLV